MLRTGLKMFTLFIVIDGGSWKRDQDLRGTGNGSSPSQQQASVGESNIDDYSVPAAVYEDVDQLGSKTGHYDQLDPSSIGVPRVYSELSEPDHAYSNVTSSPAYELIR